MARFCETLAETGLVVDACLAAGKSSVGAYALRRRNSLFAAAWEAALTIARARLADTLLARSIEGTVEQYYKDGELVGEKKVIDNRLGLAILRRLDRMAETGSPLSTRGERGMRSRGGRSPVQRQGAAGAAGLGPVLCGGTAGIDWDVALDALRTGDPDSIARALAMFEEPAGSSNGDELNELNDPRYSLIEDDVVDDDALVRCWQDEGSDVWWTDFPPPPGFESPQRGTWGDHSYRRQCTDQEAALLDADVAAEDAGKRAGDEVLRDSYFAGLKR